MWDLSPPLGRANVDDFSVVAAEFKHSFKVVSVKAILSSIACSSMMVITGKYYISKSVDYLCKIIISNNVFTYEVFMISQKLFIQKNFPVTYSWATSN
jgi:hypothetical protein